MFELKQKEIEVVNGGGLLRTLVSAGITILGGGGAIVAHSLRSDQGWKAAVTQAYSRKSIWTTIAAGSIIYVGGLLGASLLDAIGRAFSKNEGEVS